MSWLDVVIGVTLAATGVWLVWELLRVWERDADMEAEARSHHPATQPRCWCGDRILRGGFPIFDHTDCVLHGVEVCQPEREVTW